jgi:heat shock protein HtpX
MLNVYEQVSRNKVRSGFIIALFIIFTILIAYLITYSFNLDSSLLIFAVGFSLFSSFSGYFWGSKMVLTLNKARPATKKEFFNFYTTVENLSIVNQTPVPKIYVIDSPAQNAFASGRDPQHAVICATTGLINKLTRTELEAVVAHELSHIRNYDIRLMTLVSILVGTITLLINVAFRTSLSRGRSNNKSNPLAIIGLVLIIFAPIISKIIQLAISRRREYFADASAVKLTRQPQGLIDALKKISTSSIKLKTASTATASLYITNPFKGNKVASMFSTHPPIEDRIKALKKML